MDHLFRIRQLEFENEQLRRKLQAALNRIDDDTETMNRTGAKIGALQNALMSQPVGCS